MRSASRVHTILIDSRIENCESNYKSALTTILKFVSSIVVSADQNKTSFYESYLNLGLFRLHEQCLPCPRDRERRLVTIQKSSDLLSSASRAIWSIEICLEVLLEINSGPAQA